MKKTVLRRMMIGFLAILTVVVMSGCGYLTQKRRPADDPKEETAQNDDTKSSDDDEEKSVAEDDGKKEYVDPADVPMALTDPDKYEGKYIKLAGMATSVLERGDEKFYLTAYHDINDSSQEFNICLDNTQNIKADDFFVIDGRIEGTTGTLKDVYINEKSLLISAEEVTVTSYTEAMVPTQKELIPQGAAMDQNGLVLTVDKVEFAEQETRLFITVVNNTSSTCSLFSNISTIVQDAQQFEPEMIDPRSKYVELPDEFSPGVTASGVLVYPPLNAEKEFTLTINAFSDDMLELQFDPYVLKVSPQG